MFVIAKQQIWGNLIWYKKYMNIMSHTECGTILYVVLWSW